MKKPLRKWTRKEILDRMIAIGASPKKIEWVINTNIQNIHKMLGSTKNPYDVNVEMVMEWEDDVWDELSNQITEDRANINYYSDKVKELIGSFQDAIETEDTDATRESLNSLVDNIVSLKKAVKLSGLATNREAKDFVKYITWFKADWVDEQINNYDYDEVEDTLKLYAGGGTHSMCITIENFSKALCESPDGGHTLRNADIHISYDEGLMSVDECFLSFDD